jgi:hypothetical protein
MWRRFIARFGAAQDKAGHGRVLLVTFFDGIVKSPETVTPAKAGVHNQLKLLDPRLRGDDEKIISATFYELIKKGPGSL